MAQQIAASPTMWNFDPVGMYFCTHSQNWSKEQGLQLEPTTMATRLHTNLAMEHSKKHMGDGFEFRAETAFSISLPLPFQKFVFS